MSKLVCKSIITVDYDSPDRLSLSFFEEYVRYRAEKLGATSIYCTPSPSRKGLHCTICFPAELTEEERLALEAALLDDPKRILFNLKRLALTGRLNDILFSVKVKLVRDVL